jgi:hypothetical protein
MLLASSDSKDILIKSAKEAKGEEESLSRKIFFIVPRIRWKESKES